jgi:hypothetical protein
MGVDGARNIKTVEDTVIQHTGVAPKQTQVMDIGCSADTAMVEQPPAKRDNILASDWTCC